ncbi:unnamed protein product [Vicia faba]|uniref:Tf2-1-like SH3-like domain-containing protein n=1 Tax=Vicia faba TaxID=3906 RepID=A0AAV1B080_VICFA|nr:unnamed protein product [Vicia faba]
MTTQSNKKRIDYTFEVGDLMLLPLQPYGQVTVNRRVSQKLSQYFGPFKVRRRIGAISYDLELPPESKIHSVIHVSKLKAFHGDHDSTQILPSTTDLAALRDLEHHSSDSEDIEAIDEGSFEDKEGEKKTFVGKERSESEVINEFQDLHVPSSTDHVGKS